MNLQRAQFSFSVYLVMTKQFLTLIYTPKPLLDKLTSRYLLHPAESDLAHISFLYPLEHPLKRLYDRSSSESLHRPSTQNHSVGLLLTNGTQSTNDLLRLHEHVDKLGKEKEIQDDPSFIRSSMSDRIGATPVPGPTHITGIFF